MSSDLIFVVLAVPESNCKLCRTHFGPDLSHRNCSGQVAHAHQVVGCAGESENPIHFAYSPMTNFSHQRDRLQPAEALFDPLPLPLADGVTGVPRRAAVNRTAATAFVVLRHMRRRPQVAALLHEVARV